MHRLTPTAAGPGARGIGAAPALVFALLLAATLASCDRAPLNREEQHGAELIARVGCGTCHSIPGIPDATGQVGPPLDGVAKRIIIAGLLPNTPANMAAWVQRPQSIVPGNAMPNMELTDHDAKDIAAYLFTLR